MRPRWRLAIISNDLERSLTVAFALRLRAHAAPVTFTVSEWKAARKCWELFDLAVVVNYSASDKEARTIATVGETVAETWADLCKPVAFWDVPDVRRVTASTDSVQRVLSMEECLEFARKPKRQPSAA